MGNSISLTCKSYFEGFQDLSTFNSNETSKNVLGMLKVASYFTIVAPLIFGIVYAASSLIDRVGLIDTVSSQCKKIISIFQKTFNPTIEEQLEQFFKSSSKTQKLFTIDGNKVGVFYNPEGEALTLGVITTCDPVVLVSDKTIPENVSKQIIAKIPKGSSYSTLCLGSINGRSTFEVLRF